jgi:two-component system OmpR family response regulator
MQNMTMSKTEKAKKMLVVEDQGEMCLILDLILSERKFEPSYVNNLLDADEYLQKNTPSLIFLDNKLMVMVLTLFLMLRISTRI